jgi:hypothetical protein
MTPPDAVVVKTCKIFKTLHNTDIIQKWIMGMRDAPVGVWKGLPAPSAFPI